MLTKISKLLKTLTKLWAPYMTSNCLKNLFALRSFNHTTSPLLSSIGMRVAQNQLLYLNSHHHNGKTLSLSSVQNSSSQSACKQSAIWCLESNKHRGRRSELSPPNKEVGNFVTLIEEKMKVDSC